MSVADYASRLRSDILDTPHVVSHSLGYEDRPPVAGIVRGSATFADGSALHFKEFLQLSPTIHDKGRQEISPHAEIAIPGLDRQPS